jgi:hypothetical protein
MWEPEDPAKPHLCVMSAHGHAADDELLLRSEVLSLVRLALYRLKEKAEDNHLITPVSYFNSQHGIHRMMCPLEAKILVLPIFRALCNLTISVVVP